MRQGSDLYTCCTPTPPPGGGAARVYFAPGSGATKTGGTSPVSPLLRTRRGTAEQAQSPHSTANCSLLGTTMWWHRYAMYTQTAALRPGVLHPTHSTHIIRRTVEAAIAVLRNRSVSVPLVSSPFSHSSRSSLIHFTQVISSQRRPSILTHTGRPVSCAPVHPVPRHHSVLVFFRIESARQPPWRFGLILLEQTLLLDYFFNPPTSHPFCHFLPILSFVSPIILFLTP
jgi:hypothetical protein